MQMEVIDWTFVAGFFVVALLIGVVTSRQAGRSESDFFLGGRNMPWWLLGFSMVATTFSTDTPNLVTDIVRQNGVAGNWVWWAFLLTGMLTVFVYARLWRRSGVLTDVAFYEIRYSGKPAAFLRGFRALYLGIFFNIMIMSGVSLAAIKIGAVTLGLSPLESILYASGVTVIFSTMGGFKGVLLTDFLLFIMAMVGSFAAAYFALGQEQVGGLSGLLAHFNENPALAEKLSFFPAFDNTEMLLTLLVIPLAVQWWSVWYPGAEPGGGGYLAQRMLAAKNEKHAIGATLFFNIAHYALRPWPWIIVALASMVIYPELSDLAKAYPDIAADKIGHDLAYSAMLQYIPAGWLGLVMTSLIAAYMSTISTHLNWGSSYVVNDFYVRFMNPKATNKQKVWVGRLSTVALMIVTALMALALQNAMQIFNILLSIGAGTGLIFILRWFWWRINAISEITAMAVSFVISVYFQLFHSQVMPEHALGDSSKLVISVGLTTVIWVAVTFLTRPTDDKTLRSFITLVNPGGPGWRAVFAKAQREGKVITTTGKTDSLPLGILGMFFGCTLVYSFLFATGYTLYGQNTLAAVCSAVTVFSAVCVIKIWNVKKD